MPLNNTKSRARRAGSSKVQQDRHESLAPLAIAVILVVISLGARYALRSVITSDLDFHILPWYAKLQKHGVLVGIGKDFYNYTPPYLYLLGLATLTSSIMSAVTAVKLLATIFDIYTAFMIYKILRLQFPHGYLPHLASALFFAAPTVVANAGAWGQADSTYTAFLLTCLYFLLTKHPLQAVVFFGIALAFKPQAIFFVPLLLIMALLKRISWHHFFFVPVVYSLLMLPAVILGRTWMEVLTVYSSQAGSGKGLTHNAPSIFVFIPKSLFEVLIAPSIVVAAIALLIWVITSWLRNKRFDLPYVLFLALISVTLTPFLLPNMHDRYFYPADTISIVLAFAMPQLWFVPILFQVVSGLSYSIYLLSAPSNTILSAGLINSLILIVLFRQQSALNREPNDQQSARHAGPKRDTT